MLLEVSVEPLAYQGKRGWPVVDLEAVRVCVYVAATRREGERRRRRKEGERGGERKGIVWHVNGTSSSIYGIHVLKEKVHHYYCVMSRFSLLVIPVNSDR